MTKPEFDKLYNEKIARGLNFPLNDLLESLTSLNNNSGDVSDFLGLFLAHQMAQNCLKTKNGNNIYINRWQTSMNVGKLPSIDIQLVIS